MLFNHNFIKNLISDDYYGSYKYKICTNEFSLRLNCNNKKLKLKNYDWILSVIKFIEGVKLDYEDTFIGKIENFIPNM